MHLKKSVTAKLVAGVAGFAMAFSMVVVPVSAQTMTTAELTAQINSLLATIASLQAQLAGVQGGSSAGASTTFTTDLTIGSTGAQVVALQDFLVAKGHLVMPVGVAKGYFGALTQSAVAKYQMSKGITPAAGYFGPITRSAVNAEGSVVTPGTPGTPSTPGAGTEGSLESFDQMGSINNESLEEGEEEEEVIGVEMDADDSDITIDRLDVEFEATTVSGSDNLDDYVDNVSVWLDGKKLADQDVDEADEDSDVYSFRFTGLKGMIEDGETAQLVVAVDAVGNIDSSDDSTWTVTIPVNGIRASDSAGISETYHSSAFSETFTVGEATAGAASVSDAPENPDARTVEVHGTNETDDVEALIFEIEAEDSDLTVESLYVQVNVSTSSVAAIVKNVELYQGSELLASDSATSTSAVDFMKFDNLDITIDEDDTETFTVKLTVNDTEAGASGVGFYSGSMASTTVSGSLIEAEDGNGDSVAVDGSAEGEDITFRTEGFDTTFVSESTSKDTDATPDVGTFVVKFKVSAFGDDIYVSASTTEDDTLTAVAADTGINFDVTGTSSASGVLTSTANKETSGGQESFRVDDGETEEFTLTVVATNADGAFHQLQIGAIQWGTTPASPKANTHYVTAGDYETDPLYLSN